MCNYCGCRAIATIGALTAEHERADDLIDRARRAHKTGDLADAQASLAELADLLRVHSAVEELVLYPAVARASEYASGVDDLFDEHDAIDAALEAATGRSGPGREGGQQPDPAAVPWPQVLDALALLLRHIDKEEHGLFPAAAIVCDSPDWEAAEAVRATTR